MQYWKRILLTAFLAIGVLYAPVGAVGMMASCRCLGDQVDQLAEGAKSGSKRSCCEREKPLEPTAEIANKSACCCSVAPTAPYTNKVRIAAVKLAEKAATTTDFQVVQPKQLVKILHGDASALHPVKSLWIWNCSQLC